jgi:hypothetical protein
MVPAGLKGERRPEGQYRALTGRRDMVPERRALDDEAGTKQRSFTPAVAKRI